MLVAKEKWKLVSVLYSLPEKAHYLINLKEHEELNRQVMVLVEILKKGYIRGNMAPFVVPTLLMPKEDMALDRCVLIAAPLSKLLSNYPVILQELMTCSKGIYFKFGS